MIKLHTTRLLPQDTSRTSPRHAHDHIPKKLLHRPDKGNSIDIKFPELLTKYKDNQHKIAALKT